MVGRLKDSSRARVISDRDGRKYYRDECIQEPGTHYLIHEKESDGEYNLVDHPANHITKYVKFGDPYGTKDARPDQNWDQSLAFYLSDEYDSLFTDELNNAFFIGRAA